MNNAAPDLVVAGHICLDIIPTFPEHAQGGSSRIDPGKLYIMGPALFSTGGAVSNTGLALQRLGVPTTLMGKVTDDLFGGEVLSILRRRDPALAEGMIVADEGHTSYSVVISPPGVDRSFLHSPGANDTFTARDVPVERLSAGQVFHFGYPPLMHHFHADAGVQMQGLFAQVQARGALTSLDMAMPDPLSPAGRIDWREWLQRTLPQVDLFLPSIEEILFMLGRPETSAAEWTPTLLREVADELLNWGARIVLLKLGERGLYLRTGNNLQVLAERASARFSVPYETWENRELWGPCFSVEVAGTTGAGDCTIAGFLAAFRASGTPAETLNTALAVGACSVEVADSTSGIRPLSEIQARMNTPWPKDRSQPPGENWQWSEATQLWHPGSKRGS